MRIFDAPNVPAQSSSQTSKAGKRQKSKRGKNQTKARVPMTPEQIRAKLANHKNRTQSKLDQKLASTKEVSTFMSEETAAKVTLNSINKNSQRFSNPVEKPQSEAPVTDVDDANVEAGEVAMAEEEPKTDLNDPNNPNTVNKLKDALNGGMLKVDSRTRQVLSEIIGSRS